MDGRDILAAEETPTGPAALKHAEAGIDSVDPLRSIAEGLGTGPFSLVLLFISSDAPFEDLIAASRDLWPGASIVACTTAGEIGASGYTDRQIIATAFPKEDFAATCIPIEDLSHLDVRPLIDRVVKAQIDLSQSHADMDHGFGCLLIDGLCLREDTVVAAVAPALGSTPLFGGSAGDGTAFRNTRIALDGHVLQDAAVLCLVRTRLRVKVFSIDHIHPTEHRMVVTEADPARRLVKSINAEPAAREYGRITGLDPDEMGPFAFAAHPVVVRLGGSHHVRAIQRVTDEGELVFFSAIDEGMVLCVAEPEDIAAHLDASLARLTEPQRPAAILSCDCLLRRIEAEQRQASRAISGILSRHGVRGFSTYGEQIGSLHVNHTMTGVALYLPDDPSC